MNPVRQREYEIQVPGHATGVASLLETPEDASALYVFAHGAGAGMMHAFLGRVASMLHADGIATLRYQFPYMNAGRRRPDPPALLEETVRAAAVAAAAMLPGVPLVAGGKSMGARMTSRAQAAEPLAGVRGLVFLGFPLHAAGRAGVARAAHLDRVKIPMLFVQGTRDTLADLDLTRGVCAALGSRATLHVVDGGDHSFNVLKRSGRAPADVMDEIRTAMTGWIRRVTG